MKGKLIVIDGTDGSGKGTHTKLLVKRLQDEGVSVETISFPTYGTESCKAVESYLNGDFGTAEETGPHFASMLYAFNRWKEMPAITKKLDAGTHVIVNRYAAANAGHQGGKIHDEQERTKFLEWVFDLEFNVFKIPEPDVTIILHMPPEVGQQFVSYKTEGREYLKGKEKDIHEADVQHLKDAEHSYLFTASLHPSWHVIECVKEGVDEATITNPDITPDKKARTLDDIQEEIYTLVKKSL